MRFPRLLLRAALVLPLAVTTRLDAQAWAYPAMQIPTVSTRDYTGALVSANGTSVLFQWREGLSGRAHVGFDAGIADFNRDGGLGVFAAGNLGRQLLRAKADQPIDLLFTAGVGATLGDGFRTLRIPIGVSAGHTFEVEGDMALTPFVHPRVSIDFSSFNAGRGNRVTENDLSIDFDLGLDWRLNRNVSFRVAGVFTGNDFGGGDDGFAIGLVWRPNGLARMR